MTCSELSSGEPLAGTATVASRFLLIEHRGRWGRDALDEETALPDHVRAAAERFEGRVLLIRQPGRTGDVAAPMTVEADPDALPGVEPLLLVCTHGRRDACCARLGVPLYDALRPHVAEDLLWQSSHHGGHRFAANLLALPWGIQLGRVRPREAESVAALLREGRIPLERYRGRTSYPPRLQAAEIAVRRELGLDAIGAVRPVGDDGATVRVAVPDGVVDVTVTEERAARLPASCGAEPEPTSRLIATARW